MTNTKIKTDMDMIREWAADMRSAEYGFFKTAVRVIEQFQNKNNTPIIVFDSLLRGKKVTEADGQEVSLKVNEKERASFVAAWQAVWDNTIRHTEKSVVTKLNPDKSVKARKIKLIVTVPEGDNGGAVVQEKLEALRMLAASKVTTRSDTFKSAFPKVGKPKSTKTQADLIAAKVKVLVAWAQENDIALFQLREALPGAIAPMVAATVEVAH